MDATNIVLSIISIVGTMSSILFAFLAFRRNNKGDHIQERMRVSLFLMLAISNFQ